MHELILVFAFYVIGNFENFRKTTTFENIYKGFQLF